VSLHLRYGMILFIASEVMFFVAWFWAYFDAGFFPGPAEQPMRAELLGGVWPPVGIETFDPWHLPLLNTLILLTSGTTVTWAHHAIIHGDREGFKNGLLLTVALGILFTGFQIYEYTTRTSISPATSTAQPSSWRPASMASMCSSARCSLAVCLFRAMQGQFTKEKHFGFEAAAWYWHFVDVVWLFLFVAIYVWGYGGGGNF
jgi:cytochrome c oxidase subunit 3